MKNKTRPQRSRVLAGALTACLTLGAFTVPAAAAAPPRPAPSAPSPLVAAPGEPTTSDEAQQEYLRANERAALLNEQTLVAQEQERATQIAATEAARALTERTAERERARRELSAAQAAARTADTRERTATARLADHQAKIDAFTDASFRGARTGTMAALFTADSPEDFLDTASTLEIVADDNRETLDAATQARQDALTASTEAAAATNAARTATQRADTATKDAADAAASADLARTAAKTATTDLQKRRAALRAEAARYAELRDQLTEEEREAAFRAAAQERERAAQLEAERARADRANREPIATTDPAAAGTAAPPAPGSDLAAPSAAAPPAESAAPAAQAAVQAALSKVGSRYVWGAAGPDSFDCSGLTSWAYAQAGVTIPRTSGGQSGLPVVSMDALQPGDLITYYSPVSHVAMYIGNGQIVHASTASKPVYVSSVYYGGPNAVAHRPIG